MAKKSKIKPTQIKTSGIINPTKIDDTKKVSFSFKRLCEKGEKFKYCSCSSNYFNTLLARLREISRMDVREVKILNQKGLRCHKIDFADRSVTENTFGVLGEDIDDEAWQFQLTSNEHGRVHGYFVGSIFYIVWLDPKHELYCYANY